MKDVIYYCEGENLDNAQYHPINSKNTTNKNQVEYYVYNWSSGSAGGIITAPTIITTLQHGRYKLTIAAGGSNEKEDNYTKYRIKLGDNIINTFKSNKKGINEYVTDEIIVNEEQSLSLEAENANKTRWIDYIYIQKVDSETDIINIPISSSDATSTPIYNLRGMKVSPTRKGLFISKGKINIIR